MYRHRFIIYTLIVFYFGLYVRSVAAESSNAGSDWRPSPGGAALRSLVFPGWGQMYARQPLKAVIYSGIQQGFMYGVYRQHKLYQYHESHGEEGLANFYRNDRNRMGWYLTAAIILSVMDAYVDAHLYKFDVSDDLAHSQGKGGFLGSGILLNLYWSVP